MDNVIVHKNQNELYHYGIKGQKWGIRRYQNPDGSLTAEGKKRAKQEYKEDNRTAYELGKQATIYGKAAVKAANRTAKLQSKYDKAVETDPNGLRRSTQKKYIKAIDSMNAAASIASKASQYRKEAEDHCESLVDKYGEEAVNKIKYKDLKLSKEASLYSGLSSANIVSERTTSPLEIAACIGGSVASVALSTAMNLPVSMVFYPESDSSAASRIVRAETKTAKEERQKNESLKRWTDAE